MSDVELLAILAAILSAGDDVSWTDDNAMGAVRQARKILEQARSVVDDEE